MIMVLLILPLEKILILKSHRLQQLLQLALLKIQTCQAVPFNQILAVSYARGDNGDPAKEFFKSGSHKEDNTMTKTVHIKGIMCARCEMRVKKALEALPFVESAAASHENGTAVINTSADFSEEAVKAAITEAGYEFVKVD